MNFQERLKKKIASFEENATPRFLKIVHDDIKRLELSGQVNSVLKSGDKMPGFELSDQNGTVLSTSDLLKDGPLVVTFYRGFWCAFCNVDLANLNHYVPEIESLGAKMITLSPEKTDYSKKIIARQKLNFNVLFDEGNKVAEKFGLKHYIGEDLKELYLSAFNVNLKQYHGNDEWALPMPSRFLIDQNGIIKYAESKADYRQRPDPDDLIEVLKTL
ncbi:MAG: peroxiredoxin-like family protein [Crocinitomicaceae bacterium]|nr:peroxiredoxin-like family protein [Crocinitomicaceae bacterium]